MRRFLSILLVVFFGLGPLMATLPGEDDARLPACCRRSGAHHCAMSSALQSWVLRAESRTAVFTARSHCPSYPNSPGAITAPVHALARAVASTPAPLAQARLSDSLRIAIFSASLRTRTNRGPPAHLSA
jgi:hypothetical protein